MTRTVPLLLRPQLKVRKGRVRGDADQKTLSQQGTVHTPVFCCALSQMPSIGEGPQHVQANPLVGQLWPQLRCGLRPISRWLFQRHFGHILALLPPGVTGPGG